MMAGNGVSTAEELQAAIDASELEYQEHELRESAADEETVAAEERQRLRRVLEATHAATEQKRDDAIATEELNTSIDEDEDGAYLESYTGSRGTCNKFYVQKQRAETKVPTKSGSVSKHDAHIVKKEYEWKITGMSWLETSLRQSEETCATSRAFGLCQERDEHLDFNKGDQKFALLYNPRGEKLNLRTIVGGCPVWCGVKFHERGVDVDASKARGSLALAWSHSGITLRHSFFIKRAGGDFEQWGETTDDVRSSVMYNEPSCEAHFFGPDVHGPDSVPSSVGIFGLTHGQLLRSEWVENDALTVKVVLETRREISVPCVPHTSDEELKESEIQVSAPSLAKNLLLMFESGKHSDVSFDVSGEKFDAHVNILSARSNVLDRELSCGMQESEKRKVVIHDCSPAAFKAMLQFLYTDDFVHVEQMVQAAEAGGGLDDDLQQKRMSLLQDLLAVTHKYEVSRLQLWCERQLSQHISLNGVCSVLIQAHLHDAAQLEQACLKFMKESFQDVVTTASFGRLMKDWPQVALKITIYNAGVTAERAKAAADAQRDEEPADVGSSGRGSSSTAPAMGSKRKRGTEGGGL
jgi:speckle-type POZ protein